MSKFIEFLEELNTASAQHAYEMENIIFQDPSSAIVKARKFAEVILNEVFNKENIEEQYITKFYDKISYLTREGYIKKEIQKSFDTIRISGNKAAHPGKVHDLAEAFKLHKEIYNIAVWFYEVYSTEQIKVPVYEQPHPQKHENIENIIQKKLEELLGSAANDLINKQDHTIVNDFEEDNEEHKEEDTELDVEENQKSTILKKDLKEGESYLLREIGRLKDSAQEAIENANQFSRFKDYLHVDRKIQVDLEEILERNNDSSKGNLILLCGNVGDGKSHLLAYLKEKKHSLIKDYTIFNDATESFSPNKDALETLSEILSDFSDQKLEHSNRKIILAINMGVLHNFISAEHDDYSYNRLKEFIEESKLFTQNITTHYNSGKFDLLSFGDYHSFELTRNGAISTFYSSLLEKVTKESQENPFYLALKEDEKNGIETMVHENYRILQNVSIQNRIVQLAIQSIIKKKLVLSARAFLNFIADIVIPDVINKTSLMTEFEVLENSLPNMLFNRVERSDILKNISGLDPIHYRSIHIDQLVINLNTLSDWNKLLSVNIKDDHSLNWFTPFLSKDTLTGYSFNLFFESFIRIVFLTNDKFAEKITDSSYTSYVKYLYAFNIRDKQEIKNFYEEIKSAIFKWKGSPRKDYIYLNKPSEKYRLAQKLHLKPSLDHLEELTSEVLESFKSTIILGYIGGDKKRKVFLEIDYPLYNLLAKVQEGYRPNKKDEEDAIKFVEFIEKLMDYGDKREELLVIFKADQRFYTIGKDDFGAFVFERE